MSTLQPTREDESSFGLWTVSWQARGPLGDATRPPIDAVEAVERLSDLGAYGITFHIDDLIPFGSDDTTREQHLEALRAALERTGLVVPMVTTNLFTHPVFKEGGLTSNRRDVRRYALRKVMRHLDLAAELGARTYVVWGGRAGSEVTSAKDVRASLDRYREDLDTLAEHSESRGYGLKFALEPKPNEPRGDIFLPTVGHPIAFIALVDLLEHGGPGGGRAYDGPRHFDYQPLRTEDADGVWASAAANMQASLLLKQRAEAYRADPEVQDALAAGFAEQLTTPTRGEGESLEDLLADRSAFEDFDADAAGVQGYGYVRLSQQAVEHLLGAR